MNEFQALVLNWDGDILKRVDIKSADVQDAIDQAKQMVDEHPVELWLDLRQLCLFHPNQRDASRNPKYG